MLVWRMLWVLLLLAPVLAQADGFAYGKGFTRQLIETDQLAVINLSPTTADVSMYIAIGGIPPGEKLTYVLPFWYAPDDFSMTEQDAATFREKCVQPVHANVQRMMRLTRERPSGTLLTTAINCASLFSLLYIPRVIGSSDRVRTLSPYTVQSTPHARAELYKIGGQDLQQLVRQSGLPEKYAETLRKYKTPYFAVMTLSGLKTERKETTALGVQYHFRHRITDGKYTYPLGTGAAWPTPIPLTEVYLNCPDAYAMKIDAPTLGKEHTRLFDFTNSASIWGFSAGNREQYLASLPKLDREQFLLPQTYRAPYQPAILPSAWHLAYAHSNPAQDVQVTLIHRKWPALFVLLDVISRSGNLIFLTFSLGAWVVILRQVLYPRWLASDDPGSFFSHALAVFVGAQAILLIVALLVGAFVPLLDMLPSLSMHFMMVAIGALVVLGLVTKLVIAYQKTPGDWRHGCTLRCLGMWMGCYALFVAITYGLLRLAEL